LVPFLKVGEEMRVRLNQPRSPNVSPGSKTDLLMTKHGRKQKIESAWE
jgi:hypothetical protein